MVFTRRSWQAKVNLKDSTGHRFCPVSSVKATSGMALKPHRADGTWFCMLLRALQDRPGTTTARIQNKHLFPFAYADGTPFPKTLLEHKASTNYATNDKQTPLMKACYVHHAHTAEVRCSSP